MPARLIICALALGASPIGPPVAHALTPLAAEATRLVRIDHHAFLAEKALAPPPFDWSTDGCSSTPARWAAFFDGPCQQHDFGYRNMGRGLALRPTERVRTWVDGRFLTEMRRACIEGARGLALTRCRVRARAMHTAVRLFNEDWSCCRPARSFATADGGLARAAHELLGAGRVTDLG